MNTKLRRIIIYLIPAVLVISALYFIDGKLVIGSLALYAGIIWGLILNEEK